MAGLPGKVADYSEYRCAAERLVAEPETVFVAAGGSPKEDKQCNQIQLWAVESPDRSRRVSASYFPGLEDNRIVDAPNHIAVS